MEEQLFSSVINDIHRLIQEDFILEAIERIFDFIRDFTIHAPNHRQMRTAALKLSARHSRFAKAQRYRLPTDDSSDGIIDALMSLAKDIETAAAIPLAEGTTDQIAEDIAKDFKARVAAGDDRPHAYGPENLKQILINATYERAPQKRVIARLENVERRYANGDFKLGPVSLELCAGEITGVVGMNASGKTTLLRILMGELAVDKGIVSYPALQTERINWPRVKSQIAYVAQLPSPWSGTQRTNLNFTAAAYGCTGQENEELVEWYLHRYGLKEYENARWDEISGGFKIRFELVRALLMRPQLLILDEPLAYLDIVTQQIFLQDLRSIASAIRNPIPIIITSQHLYEIEAIANRMVILDDGACMYSGPLSQIPIGRDYLMYEIEADVDKAKILEALRPVGLADMEATTLGWILVFEQQSASEAIERALLENFGGKLRYFRNISRSTRCLFRNHRSDLERTWMDEDGVKPAGGSPE